MVTRAAEGKLYSSVATVPFRKTGMVPGTSKFLPKGYLNPYYVYRLHAAIDLYRSGKISVILVSGDNGRKSYNEPEMMRSDLIHAGIDSSHIYLDYAGFRTFDSMVRLHDIFSQDSVTVISQQFQNERALYIASRLGISAIGFNAQDVNKSLGFRVQLREKFARVKVILDFLFGKKPKYLGPKIIIP